jgi:hypothetical protein
MSSAGINLESRPSILRQMWSVSGQVDSNEYQRRRAFKITSICVCRFARQRRKTDSEMGKRSAAFSAIRVLDTYAATAV